MGGHYPSNAARSRWGVPVPTPGRDFQPTPARDPYHPRRTMPQPKYPWRPPGYFPNGWKPPRKVFGKRGLPVSALKWPTRNVRFSPWALAPVPAALTAWLFGGTKQDLAAHGYSLCCSVPATGPHTVSTFTLNTQTGLCAGGLASLCGTGGQPWEGIWPRALPAYDNRQRGLFVLIGTQVGQPVGRARWEEVWHKPRIATGPAVPIPSIPVQPVYVPEIYPWPIYDFDPNWWPPLHPVPWSPPTPQPVWTPDPVPKTYPPPKVGGYELPIVEPVPVPISPPVPSVGINPDGTVTILPPHVIQPPRGPTKEGKYGQKKGFGLLSAILLRLASGTYGGITEVMDLVAAIYAALPAKMIAQQPDFPKGTPMMTVMTHMIETIALNPTDINIGKAVYNLAENAVEDKAWGRYFAAVNQLQRQTGGNYNGWDRTLSDLNETFNDVMSASR